MNRRTFLIEGGKLMSLAMLAPMLPSCTAVSSDKEKLFFTISLAQWSMHRQLRSGELKVLDFPEKTKKAFDIDAVEYVNQFFMDKAEDQAFLQALKSRADDNGVKSLLIMIDAEGELGELDDNKRVQAVENHYKWVTAAKYLGCHSIRVNAAGKGSAEDVKTACIDGLSRLSEFADDHNVNVIVENHGGLSSDGQWLSDVIRSVDMTNCGTLPDFGNFADYNRYQGVKDLMPFAKGVSAKSHKFDNEGNEINTDYLQMLSIIKAANYRGYIGIEFEGPGDEDTGILATKRLLESAALLV